ncbi:MAG: RDD family protein [Elusimicrobiota bacterium]
MKDKEINNVKFGKRIISYLIDLVIVLIVVVVLIGIVVVIIAALLGHKQYTLQHAKVEEIIATIFLFIYYGHPLKKQGQTIGEKIMKIKVLPKKGEKINLISALGRFFFFAPLLAIAGAIPFEQKDGSKKSILEIVTRTVLVPADESK